MAGLQQGTLKKLLITACSIDPDSGKISLKSGEKDKFQVMMNPQSYTHQKKISYNKEKTQGSTGSNSRFHKTLPDEIGFKIEIDGTGVVRDYATEDTDENHNPTKQAADVKTQLKELNNVVYDYKGIDHEPQVVRLLWGSMIFYGRLASMGLTYKMFKPNGEPLRASVDLKFTGFVSKEESSLAARTSSPDLTHVVEVKAGDTLPLLCNRVYKDSAYYLAVAEANGLNHFRDIKPGQKLIFPPLS